MEDQHYSGPFGFFRKHWNGDYSLARSYWVNTLLLTWAAPALGMLVRPVLQDAPARYGSMAALAVIVGGLIAWVWAVRGTWASANKHVSRGGSGGWAVAAKFMIVVGLLNLVSKSGPIGDSLLEHAKVAAGHELGPKHVLTLAVDGRSVILEGGMNDGAAAALEELLGADSSVSVVVFRSGGGWVREGNRMAEVIRRHRLATYVDSECTSACTIAFLAGVQRSAHPGAKLGFHQFRAVGSIGNSQADIDQARQVYGAAGLSSGFIGRVVATPHDSVWYPGHAELFSEGVLTRTSMGGELALAATRLTTKDAVAEELKREKAFAALADRYPAHFEAIVSAAWDRVRARQIDAQVFAAARSKMSEAYLSLLPLGTDETLASLHELVTAQAKSLRQGNAAACVELVFPSGAGLEAANALPPELQRRELDLFAELARTAQESNRTAIPEAVSNPVFLKIGARLTGQEIRLIEQPQARAAAGAQASCDAIVQYLDAIGALAPHDKTVALRATYGAANAK